MRMTMLMKGSESKINLSGELTIAIGGIRDIGGIMRRMRIIMRYRRYNEED